MTFFLPNSSHARRFSKFFEWGKLFAITGLSQVLVQAIGMLSGIIIIRLLPTTDYAIYVLANTILGTMSVLADGGISIGIMSEGSKIWQDRQKLGGVFATGLDIKKIFAVSTILISTPFLLFILRHHGTSWLNCTLILLSTIPAFYTTLSGSILEIAPKLWQNLVPLQKIQVTANVSRLIFICLVMYTFPFPFLIILSAALPQLWVNIRLRSITSSYADMQQKPDPIVRKAIITILKRRLPDVIYYCFSSQIIIWIISIMGSTKSVAEVGALGRLALVINLFNVLFSSIVLPRFARLPQTPKLLIKRYLQIQLGLLTLSAAIIMIIWIFDTEILWVLGENYSGLTNEMLLLMTGSCLSLISWASNFLCTSRGWIINPAVSILTSLIILFIGVFLIDISTVKGIFMLNILIFLTQAIMWSTYGLIKMFKVQ